MYRKRYLAGGLIKGMAGKIIKGVVKGDNYKKFSKEVKNFVKKSYKGKDKTLARHEEKLRKIKPMKEALEDVVVKYNKKVQKIATPKETKKNISVSKAARDALDNLKSFEKQKKLEAREYIQSKGKTKN
tara:strand:+ start:355 stop:741 length:387 start_codon:yes stop_codon:yes gene_type:complete